MKENTILGLAVFALLILNIFSLVYTQLKIAETTRQETPTTMAVGTAYLCINHPPSNISLGTCNSTIFWGININCTVNATDPDNDSTYFASYFSTPTQLFNVTNAGKININLAKSAIGNHTLAIIANDFSGCDGNQLIKTFNIEVFDMNHAPYLSTIIPNNSIRWDTSYAFSLDDYFTDIDDDNLTYIAVLDDNYTSVSVVEPGGFTTIRGLDCGDSYFYFIATDPYGETATSNTVRYTVTNCPQDSGTTGTNTGRGGGGSYYECTPDWRCSKWSSCQENNTRTLRCIDYNGCNANGYIKFLTENCTYIPPEYTCEEKWECTEWSTCTDSTHTRTCQDKNSCGTEKQKPSENESCVPIPSCFNGIKDGDETEVDCGGSCGACRNVEQPAQISNFDSRILIAVLIIIAVIALLIFALRKQIKSLIEKMLAYKRKKKQPVYLTEVQKQKILNLLFALQDRIDNGEKINLSDSINPILQLYFMELLKLDIPTKEKIIASMNKLENKQLESILLEFYKNTSTMKKMETIRTQEKTDEFFNHLYLVAEFHEKDALILTKERELTADESVGKFYQKLSNLHIALEFKEIVQSKNLYKELLADYNNLSREQKLAVYDDMMIVYNIILYLERFY